VGLLLAWLITFHFLAIHFRHEKFLNFAGLRKLAWNPRTWSLVYPSPIHGLRQFSLWSRVRASSCPIKDWTFVLEFWPIPNMEDHSHVGRCHSCEVMDICWVLKRHESLIVVNESSLVNVTNMMAFQEEC
jgi:hypothetical protein